VAPSDPEAAKFPSGTTGFAPMPLVRLPFPSVVVASSNDPFVTVSRAQTFATAWGSEFVMIGEAGHINGASGLGDWPEGLAFLRSLRENSRTRFQRDGGYLGNDLRGPRSIPTVNSSSMFGKHYRIYQ
jgi:predicted alpha/beta hydrolase family esterase